MSEPGRFDSKEMVLAAAAAAAEKKATDLLVLEIAKLLDIADYFLICSGSSNKQTKAISNEVRRTLRENGSSPLRVAGEGKGDWILLDYGDLVIHIFTEETRDYYQLERLWRDAAQLDVADVTR